MSRLKSLSKIIRHLRLTNSTLAIAAGVALATFGVWGYIQRYRATHQLNPKISNLLVTHTSEDPEETPPKEACDTYTVADHLPRKIELPDIGISSCIQQVGLTDENQIAAPSNIHLAGWYTGSTLPGEQGVSIIDGHVMGRYSDAIFTNLDKIAPDNIIRVQLGDMSWMAFKVVVTQSYSVEDSAIEQFEQLDDADRQLTLITCSGTFSHESRQYDKRLIVRAVLAG